MTNYRFACPEGHQSVKRDVNHDHWVCKSCKTLRSRNDDRSLEEPFQYDTVTDLKTGNEVSPAAADI